MKTTTIVISSLALISVNVMAQKSIKKQPNVVLIITDQQSYNTISGLSNKTNFCQTPNIDRLVKQGTSFTQVYCSNPVSVPSRFALFTGKYGGQYSIRENQCRGANEEETRRAILENGMGHVFNKGGYETVYAGKVHLPFAGKKTNSKFTAPTSYGFKTYLTKNERAEMSKIVATFISKRKKTEKPYLLVSCFLNPHDICLEGSTNLSATVRGNKPEKTATVRMLRKRAAAIDSLTFYEQLAPKIPSNFAKTIEAPTTKYLDKKYKILPKWYWRKYRWTYAELVKMVDEYVGRVLDAIENNPDWKDNTIVIFTSDHGDMQGAHQLMAKSLPYDECQRVPLLMVGPGMPVNKLNNTSVCNGVDLLPTLCELCDIESPKNADGLSFAKELLEGKDGKRAYVYSESAGFLTVVKGKFKYILFDGDKNKEMLFDLSLDPEEKYNIIAKHPSISIEFKKIIKKYHPRKISKRNRSKRK